MNSTLATTVPKSWFIGRRVVIGLVLLGLAFYAAFIATHVGAVAAGSDASGYLNQARALAAGETLLAPRELPGLPMKEAPAYLYSPLGIKPAADGESLVLTYPIGLPLLIVGAHFFTGWAHAGDWVVAVHMLAGVCLVYAWLRAIKLPVTWSMIGAVIVGLSPLYLHMGLQAMSDVPALVWTTAAILAAWHSRQTWKWACAAGAAFAIAVLIRPNNLLAIIPIAIALGISLPRWIAFGLSGLPGAVILALYNLSTYGHAFSTGYPDPSGLFHPELIGTTLLHYLRWLPVLFTPVVLLALGLPLLVRREPRISLILVAWITTYAGFYVSYYHTHETWWYLRFLLPAVPALVGAGMLVTHSVTSRWALHVPRPIGVTIALLAIAINAIVWNRDLTATDIGRTDQVYPQSANWAKHHLPADAIIAAMQVSGTLFYYTDFTLIRWDMFSEHERGRVMEAIAKSGRPFYAILFPFEQSDALERRLGGKWTKIESIRHITIWRRDAAP